MSTKAPATDLLPQWTSYIGPTERPGEDHLGIEAAAQTYQGHLLDGIITTTDRARYYSFYAWVLWRFITAPESSRRESEFKPYFQRHELAYVLACYSHHVNEPLRGLVGAGNSSSKARTFWNSSNPVSLKLPYFGGELPNTGGFGQYYSTAMAALEIIVAPEKTHLVARMSRRGEQLALAYDEAIRTTAYYKHLIAYGQLETLSHEEAQEYGAAACLCAEVVAASQQERDLLRAAFFRFDQMQETSPHARRRLSLGLLLDMVAQSAGRRLDAGLRTALYLDQFDATTPYRPHPTLAPWHLRWKLVQARQVYTSGLQILWHAFLEHLKVRTNQPVTFERFLASVADALPDGLGEMPLSAYLDALCRDVGFSEPWADASVVFDEACRLGAGGDEITRYRQLLQQSRSLGQDVAGALRILLQFFLRFYPRYREPDEAWREVAAKPRLPLITWFSQVERLAQTRGATLHDLLAILYREYVIGQHESIALEKLRYQQHSTFKFFHHEDGFVWAGNPASYTEPLRYPTLRLFNALTILADLGLVTPSGTGGYHITEDGDAMLHRILARDGHGH